MIKPEERQPYHCPVCGEFGEMLMKTAEHNTYIYACPKCHCLFWEEV